MNVEKYRELTAKLMQAHLELNEEQDADKKTALIEQIKQMQSEVIAVLESV